MTRSQAVRTVAQAQAGALGAGPTAASAAGSLATGIFSTVPTVLLLYFCTEQLAIPPAYAALIVFVPKAWAIVWDPFVGRAADRSSVRFARSRAFMLWGSAGMAIAFVAVFTPPDMGVSALAFWVGASYFALATLYSLFAVPYIAIPSQIGETEDQRRRLVSWRMTIAMIGVLIGAAAAPLLVSAAGGGRGGYAFMALVIAAVSALAIIPPIRLLNQRFGGRVSTQAAPDAGGFWRTFRNRRFVKLLICYGLLLTGLGGLSSVIPYLVTKALTRPESDVGVALLTMLTVTTASVPAWSWAAKRWGEARALFAAIIGFGAFAIALGLAAAAAAPWSALLCLLAAAGGPVAGIQVLPFTMAAHVIHDQARSDSASEALFTGVWTAGEKLGLALGPATAGLALAIDANAARSASAFAVYAPATIALLSMLFLSAFLTEKTQPMRDFAR